MKNTAKAFIWVGMIIQFFLIYPIVVGIIALKKLDEATNKEELQTMGIVTLLFCSLISGILMLNLSNNDICENKRYVEKRTVEYPENITTPSVVFILSIVILPVLIISTILSIIPVANYGDAFIPLILNCCSIFTVVMLIIMYRKINNYRRLYLFVDFALFALSIATLVLSILNVCGYALFDYSSFDMPNLGILIGCGVCSVVIIAIAVAIFILVISPMIANGTKIVQKVERKTIIEYELDDAKNLFDKNLITEDEYKKARETIIAKYYK